MKSLKSWTLSARHPEHVDFTVDGKHLLSLYVLDEKLMRVLIRRQGECALDRTWLIAPNDEIAPWAGRNRLDCTGFPCPGFQIEEREDTVVISTESLRVTLHQPLWLEWECRDVSGDWQPLMADRKTGAYMLDAHGTSLAHFQQRDGREQFFGLGEKSGDLNRSGRLFEMRSLDAMGYDAEKTDPLYKHFPFYIRRSGGISCGLFYDNLANCWFDLGNELDNYHAWYTRYHAEAGDLDYYVLFGPTVKDVTQGFVRLTGRTAFLPKWSLGYSGSTMSYTDAPNAQECLQEFIVHCHQHAIPCDSFQLSSGYTSIGTKRYVFNWNYDKVPDPKGLSAAFNKAGMRLAANIKPCLLQDHPKYKEAEKAGLFIRDSEADKPERSVFWDDEGSHLDFTNPDTIMWWKGNVTTQLLEMGIGSTWNDNNEYVVWDGEARCNGFGKGISIKLIRPLMSLLMMRTSYDAQRAFAPEERPYLISRSGCPGLQRYVQTWSGDNRTDWKTIRYNQRMALGMSLSGMYNMGHDVGGFAGPKPGEELFVRWVQNGVMHPRFTIHSWNDDQTVNEPWMYPRVTAIIREAINLRYRLMPYLYTTLYRAHAEHEPMMRPTFLDHEHDTKTFSENDEFLLGQDILVASVMDEGARERALYLPQNDSGWYCWHSGQWFAGGQSVTLDAPLERLPLLARAGAVIPLSSRLAHVVADDTEEIRNFALFPHQGRGCTTSLLFEDDGLSFGYEKHNALWLELTLDSYPDRIEIKTARRGVYQPAWQRVSFQLPAGEHRPLFVNGKPATGGAVVEADVLK